MTVCGEKEPQTDSRNRVYFQLSLPFFKNVKELGDIWSIKKYQNPEIEFYVIFHDVNRSRLRGNVRWGTFLITIEQVTYILFLC